MSTNQCWSIDDRRLNFQFGTEIGWLIKDGRRTQMVKNPTYTGITPQLLGQLRRDLQRRRVDAVGRPELRQGRADADAQRRPRRRPRALPRRGGRSGPMVDRAPGPRRIDSLLDRALSLATDAEAEAIFTERRTPR